LTVSAGEFSPSGKFLAGTPRRSVCAPGRRLSHSSRPQEIATMLLHSVFQRQGWNAARNQDSRSRPGNILPRHSKPRAGFLPCLEALEDRTVLSTFLVSNLNDSGDGSLRAAIAAANTTAGADEIDFAGRLQGAITLTSGELLITDSITINGPGANLLSVSGNNSSRVFDMTAGLDVTINDLTITQGFALDQAGGILNQGSNLMLSADVLSQNVALGGAGSAARGGGLRSLDGALTITGCTFTDNEALGGTSSRGAGVGGGLYILAGTAVISNSTFTSNEAIGSNGVTNAVAGQAEGGAILSAGPVASLTITDCTFSGNLAVGGSSGTGVDAGDAFGGAILPFGASNTISGSEFDHNQAIGGNNCNSGPGQQDPVVSCGFGGAFSTGSVLNVTSTAFSHNLAVGGNNAAATATDIAYVGLGAGGAIDNEFGDSATISGCDLDHNQALGGNSNSGSGPVVLVGTALGGAANSAEGGVDIGPNTTNISNSALAYNVAKGGDNNNGAASVAGLVGAGAGAGIANFLGGTTSVGSSEIDNGQATGGNKNTTSGAGAVLANLGAGGGIFNYLGNYCSSGFGMLDPSAVTVTDSTLHHNVAQGGRGGAGLGGGIADVLSASTAVAGSTVTQNQANGGKGAAGLGGGAYNDASSSLSLTTSSVTNNQANGTPGTGGGVYTVGMFNVDMATVITDNQASTSDNNIGP
jgi:hypothetical protein